MSLLLTLNIFHTLFGAVFIVNFEYVITVWDVPEFATLW